MRAIDFFCGTGGFSHGAHAAGFEVAAAFDSDPILTSSFHLNFPKTKLVLGDLAATSGEDTMKAAGGPVDLVFGGPPCQGFSSIGRRQKSDPRRTLLGHFFRLVAEVQPRAFVMENVQGLGYQDALPELQQAIKALPDQYVVLDPLTLDASDFGAATTRKRLFVIGYDPCRSNPISMADLQVRRKPKATVADALSGIAQARKAEDSSGFDMWQIPLDVQLSGYAEMLVGEDRRFTGNRPTKHTLAVQTRFRSVPPGMIDKVGRHHRLSWSGQAPTLRAGTGSELGSYQSVRPLHPDEPRVITVREAARLQGFPDWHLFHPTIWHSFRMIGNSVSPLISRAVLSSIAAGLANTEGTRKAA